MPGIELLLFGIEWLDLEWWLGHLGETLFWIGLLVVFIECGLLFPFLPGDTLLFSLGLFIATGQIDLFPGGVLAELVISMLLLVAAAFGGNVVGYEIGRRIGPPLYQRNGRFIKRKHFDQTHDFFDRHGSIALVLGRFVAFVRTFITVVAGATGMPRRTFWLWSFIGAVLWVVAITLLGYFLGGIPWLGDNLDFALLLILAVFAVPLILEWRRESRATRP
ncbi:Inner membrane protein YghB [Nocardioides dokdonensis FR1436]|uniref:Inner membrane protein YghB n=1 Tax=Nocardioides dokdonensis FR1436 TaxID=1300347 RepID=A0A1A9GGH6_9ACTN|nr:VTT domain-containing protein [Nocardioides dokdonensis]ANH37378.1 Inner membrane protein YghB [Nocardioides dokdonensis FR1436]